MPNRLIKESICSSESVNELSWFEEAMFYRLIVNCDDYGCFDARPAILKARLFPLKSVTEKQISDGLNKLSTAGIVQLYEYEQKPYLQFVTWACHQQIRAKRSKFPLPDESCKQLISSDGKCPRNPIQSESNPNLNPNPNKCTEVADDRHSMPVVSLPLNDKTFYPIEQDQIDKWSELYGSVDVLSELKKMIGWLDADPKRRKTRSGILRFIAGWLSRQQDKPHFSKDLPKSQNFEGVKYDDQFLNDLDTDPAEFMNRMDRMKGEQHE